MRNTIWVVVAVASAQILGVGGVAVAETYGSHGAYGAHGGYEWELTEEEMLPYNETFEAFLDAHESDSIEDLTIADLRALSAQLSIVAQEEDYVRSARQASRVFPGAGQFMIGDVGRGVAFTAGSIAIVAGTLVGTYFVLPNKVQFHETDYINDSFQEIGQAWRDQSIFSLLPAFGVLVGGGIVHGILSEVAATDAELRARAQIESGAKRFEPRPFIYPDANGRLILGARIGL
jgi:TM2 domain-containing membrane protein YozV